MPSNFTDGVPKTVLITGWLPTLGLKNGVKPDLSESEEEQTNAELKPVLSEDSPNPEKMISIFEFNVFFIIFIRIHTGI